MSLQVKISLTDSGNRPPSTVFKLYGNLDNYTTQIGSDIPLSELTDPNNPYFVTVGDGTTILRLSDVTDGCIVDLTISETEFCLEANFSFSTNNNNLVGRIDVGDLLSNNQGITDYRIFWYNENNEVSYISGYGSEFQPYSLTHPLTGVSAIFAQYGTYQPVIDKVRVDGVNYSQSGNTLDSIPVDLQDCLNDYTVLVDAFNCNNGDGYDLGGVNYEHRVEFKSLGGGTPPTPLESTFELTSNTNYFVWAFYGVALSDTVKLTFIGSNYTEPIGLDYIEIGQDATGSDNQIPYGNRTFGYHKSITTLTGLTVNDGDKILMEIIPNDNPNTDWTFYFSCKETIEVNECLLPQKTNQDVKLIASRTIFNGSTSECSTSLINLFFKICGNYPHVNDDLMDYSNSNFSSNSIQGRFNSNSCNGTPTYIRTCDTIGNQYSIQNSYNTNTGLVSINITYTDEGNFNSVSSRLDSEILSYNNSNFNQNEGSYYRYLVFGTPDLGPDEACDENTGVVRFYIPLPNLTKTTDNSGGSGPWTISMTAPLLNRDVTIPCCDNIIDAEIDKANEIMVGNDRSLTFNTGQSLVEYIDTDGVRGLQENLTDGGSLYTGFYGQGLITRPFTGETTTPNALEYYGAPTDNEFLLSKIYPNPGQVSSDFWRYIWVDIEISSVDNPYDFKVFRTKNNVNGVYVDLVPRELIYHYDGPDGVYDQQYVVEYDPNYVEI